VGLRNSELEESLPERPRLDSAYRQFLTGGPGRCDHRFIALPLRAIRGKQQSLRPGPVVRRRRSHERTIYGQGFKGVRLDRRVGIRSFSPGGAPAGETLL